MRKTIAILALVVFVCSFMAGFMAPKADAALPCTAACIHGNLRVCCYNAQGVYTCTNRGHCIID
jgi:hypothetical protein